MSSCCCQMRITRKSLLWLVMDWPLPCFHLKTQLQISQTNKILVAQSMWIWAICRDHRSKLKSKLCMEIVTTFIATPKQEEDYKGKDWGKRWRWGTNHFDCLDLAEQNLWQQHLQLDLRSSPQTKHDTSGKKKIDATAPSSRVDDHISSKNPESGRVCWPSFGKEQQNSEVQQPYLPKIGND